MWSLGKVFSSPEVPRVYIGSFRDTSTSESKKPLNPLFEKEQEDLLHDLYNMPKISCDRRVNEFVKRVRAAKIHFLIMGHLRKQMPYFGQKKAQQRLLDRLQVRYVCMGQKVTRVRAGACYGCVPVILPVLLSCIVVLLYCCTDALGMLVT
jgi:hypothetical protein